MRIVAALVAKDLKVLLGRSTGTVLALIGYPLLVALLVALAVDGGRSDPRIAVVNLDDSGRTLDLGDRRVGVGDYIDRITDRTESVRLDDDQARRALSDGRVAAVLRIPDGFIAGLGSSAVEAPRLELIATRRDPLEAREITRRIEAALFRESQELSDRYIEQVRQLIDVLTVGGTVELFGRSGHSLGLEATADTLVDIERRLLAIGADELAERLGPLARFVDQTSRNLERAGQVAESIGEPIVLDVQTEAGPVAPVSGYGLAAAITLAIGVVAALLGASLLGAERDDRTLGRLLRGQLGAGRLVAAKIVAAALPTVAVGLVALTLIDATTEIAIDRWHLWPVALALAAAMFAAAGVALATLVRDGRSALLVTLMVVAPAIFLGVVPLDGALERPLSLLGAGAAFESFRALLVEPVLTGATAAAFSALAVATGVLGALATLVLTQRSQL